MKNEAMVGPPLLLSETITETDDLHFARFFSTVIKQKFRKRMQVVYMKWRALVPASSVVITV